MALRRVFVDWLHADRAAVEGARAHHLARVVRLTPGEQVEISDLKSLFEAEVETANPKEVVFRIVRPLPLPPERPALEVHLAVIKFPRFEWALEKLTELGVSAIVPVAAERSDRALLKAADKRLGRWRAIVEEAAQQSRRLAPPEVTEVAPFAEALARPVQTILLDVQAPLLREVLQPGPAALLIGPEGGWTDAERKAALASGAKLAGFGDTVLRTETAAIAAAAIALSA